jgi:hypothetical protein
MAFVPPVVAAAGAAIGAALSNPYVQAVVAGLAVEGGYRLTRKGILRGLKSKHYAARFLARKSIPIYKKMSHPIIKGGLAYLTTSVVGKVGKGISKASRTPEQRLHAEQKKLVKIMTKQEMINKVNQRHPGRYKK